MADLKTTYLGLELRNPIIVSSSGLTNSVDKIKKLDKSGAGAIVIKSIFAKLIQSSVETQFILAIIGIETCSFASFIKSR